MLILDGVDSENRLNTINYKPVLVQTLIPGDDIGASVYARAGKIEAYVAHWLRRKVYHTFHDERIYSDISKIIETLGVDGVLQFRHDIIAGRVNLAPRMQSPFLF